MLRFLFLQPQKKPYSAITVQIDQLTSEQYEADDLSGIVDLIEVIRLQAGGPTEAARAIRKKLYVRLGYKYMKQTKLKYLVNMGQFTNNSVH